jgi:hypothetical protein
MGQWDNDLCRSRLTRSTVHPLMNVAADKTPMLSNLRSRQFADPREFVDGGFRHPKELCDLHHGQDFPVPCRRTIQRVPRYCRSIAIHDTRGIGEAVSKLEPVLYSDLSLGGRFLPAACEWVMSVQVFQRRTEEGEPLGSNR